MTSTFQVGSADPATCNHRMYRTVSLNANDELIEDAGGKGRICSYCGSLGIDGDWHAPVSKTRAAMREKGARTNG